ncbi:TRAP transporter small permease [Shimwellia blattae]|uniref:TRAP transporter small permease protein n=1 Tax=Shimwellia blattae (strain ATCC 29907 / DSM 4481 / JCM 1650 / NBRC 105725 / CDC 9005-74) TaxID=630626 RepID=I2BDG0_SHIBC|nr:TRAP transporter small permease [Shimwellia blattae]AFJ48564.1 putative tripartite ATP-independent periplasmic transporter [Shimwellia blattae DSM 4481 = NBRC 105725]GAB81400.1 2,3-diketo-L-gulonate transporter small subunit YiaM [Shimwellia blattae DSM 4481 = NBRC 105725]VDY66054.1 2,3-diketo-L-gulonate TRAP transporter small permease protein YiaM [Shimwellia blattae]VEC26785.1 2,3-diketo-L-gulonate TRAP transporter small permease protein YiaM [Shimwellia blattae]
MGERYSLVMDLLYRVSMWIAGIALLIMVSVIPVGIFARYVMNNALSWPEPISILCMVTFTFIGAAVSYRAGAHIAVTMLTERLGESGRKACGVLADIMLLAISVFILWYGGALCLELWQQPVAEFPLLTAGQNYLPLPIGSAITILFIFEKIVRGPQNQRPVVMLGSTT